MVVAKLLEFYADADHKSLRRYLHIRDWYTRLRDNAMIQVLLPRWKKRHYIKAFNFALHTTDFATDAVKLSYRFSVEKICKCGRSELPRKELDKLLLLL